MVRTAADRGTFHKNARAVGAKNPVKLSYLNTDGPKAPHGLGNSVCHRKTPGWQKPITNFFSKTPEGAKKTDKEKPTATTVELEDSEEEDEDESTLESDEDETTLDENKENRATNNENSKDPSQDANSKDEAAKSVQVEDDNAEEEKMDVDVTEDSEDEYHVTTCADIGREETVADSD